MLPLLIGVGIAAAAALVFFALWDWVRDTVSTWIRENYGEASKVMDAWVQFVRIGNTVRLSVKAIVPKRFLFFFEKKKTVTVSEDKEVPFKKLPPEVREQLAKRSTYQEGAMQYFNMAG